MPLQLYEHQNIALPVLLRMEQEGKGGFLADECGLGKCLDPNTKVLIWKGGFKFAKDIIIGDLLVGDDSSPRTVLSTCSGTEMMYEIQQTDGENYTVNEPHILSLKVSQHKNWFWYDKKQQYILEWFDKGKKCLMKACYGLSYGTKEEAFKKMLDYRNKIPNDDIVDITVKDYLKLNKTTQKLLKGFKVGVDYPKQKVIIDPYLLGVWLGDESRRHDFQSNINEIRHNTTNLDNVSYIIPGCKRVDNQLLQLLDKYNSSQNKHIPIEYLYNSREVRLSVLAGLLDTGGYPTHDNCCYEITQKVKQLSLDIAYLARSLGFFVSYKKIQKSCMYKGKKKTDTYFKCCLSGNGLHEIPILTYCKKDNKRKIDSNAMLTNITIRQVGKGGYCGFTIDGNRRFLLHDFTVTHNTILMATHLMQNKIPYRRDLIVCPMSLLEQWKRELKRVYKASNLPKPKILLFHGPKRETRFVKRAWDYIITTYSILGSGQLNKFKWGRVILDESHTIRNGLASKKPKAATAAFIVGKHSKYNWCMSATPFCNRMKDISAQCKFIGTRPYNDPKWWKKQGKEPSNVQEWRTGFVLRRTKEHILAPPLYHDIEVEPTRQEVLLIEKIREKAQKKFERWKLAKGLTKIQLQGQILALIQRLRVVSNSYYSGETYIDVDKVVHENAKVNVMLETLDRKIWDDPTHSVVIFSQFTSYLDILEKVIDKHMVGVKVMKFNGSMSSKDRDEVVHDFTTAQYPRVLLVSLMAGGVGLNLMPCATVFLSEPYYNPFLEKQAEERVHRLGQDHQVNVYRFSMTNSVETWINGLKKKKLFLASGLDLLAPHENSTVEFSFNDLSELFKDLVGFQKTEEEKERRLGNRRARILDAEQEYTSHIPSHQPTEIFGIDCSICLEDVGSRLNIVNLGCGHLFHSDCINQWKNINDACPMCKRTIRIL
jgi:superfamily II DNA or RNA helicase